MEFRKKLIYSLFIFTFLSLSGCCSVVQCPEITREIPRPCEPIVADLEGRGVQVIQKGDTVRLMLYSDRFFKGVSTTKLKPSCAVTLARIADLLECGCYANYVVRVTGYTDEVGTPEQRRARGKQQAQTIAAYLWNYGIPLQRLRVEGAGGKDALSSNMTNRGSAANRRVEIAAP